MEEKYKPILPEDVFVTIFERKATEAELWTGLPANFEGNRPSGNNFIDLFARLVRKYGRKDIDFYARLMAVRANDLKIAIRAMSGLGASEWRNRYLLLEIKELLEKTDMQITDIAKRLGFSQHSVLTKFFHSNTGQQPWEWRINKQKPDNDWKKTYHRHE